MGLKITTEIETDKGITSEAYVRIGDYRVNKYKSAVFMLEIYNSQSEAEGIVNPVAANDIVAKNAEIGQMIYLVLEDFVEIEAGNIFEYGYTKLKEKLVGLYGEENVIDC